MLYLALVLRGASIASRARDNLGALLAAGLTGTIFWQVVINIGMTSGALPVVGITLPFLSYGGSSMLALLRSVGLLMNVSMRRLHVLRRCCRWGRLLAVRAGDPNRVRRSGPWQRDTLTARQPCRSGQCAVDRLDQVGLGHRADDLVGDLRRP